MAQLVEQRIRNAWVAGSSPAIGSPFPQESEPTKFWLFLFSIVQAELAQLVEHWLPKPRVAGSSPVFRSAKKWKNKERVKKVCKIFGSFKKTPYLCTRNQGDNPTVDA